MRRSLSYGALVLLGLMTTSGCAIGDLKETNRRLKESNDILTVRNNELEQEVQDLQRQLELATVVTLPEETPPVESVLPNRNVQAITMNPTPNTLPGEPEVLIETTQKGTKMTIPHQVFFAPGQAKLSLRGQRLLNRIGGMINNDYAGRMVRVDGHTDSTPIRKVRDKYPTNWELSTARACTVVRYLVDRVNVDARRIFPAGFAYYRPARTGSGPSSRSQNRRVEIMILNESA